MKKLIIGLTLVMLILAIAILAIACNPPDNIQMAVTIDGLEKGEEATLTLSLSPGIDPAEKPLFQQTIRSDGERSLTVEITTSLKDGYYLLLLEAPEKYFREPKGYLFQVFQSQIVNPVGRSIIFDLIPPSAQTFKPYRESEESTGISDDEVTYMAEALISLSAPPKQPPPPAPTQTPKTTKVTPEPGGKGILGASASFPAMTLDELITHSDAIIIGKVADILPARKGKDPRDVIPEIIYQDVIVQTERYLYGTPESEFVAIRVLGGKVGDMYFIADVDPEFTVGEEVLLFLYVPPERFIQNVPEGIDSRSIYKVTASIPGKYELKDDIATSYKGETTDISTVEEKIVAASRNQ